jgi:hypothetical protein
MRMLLFIFLSACASEPLYVQSPIKNQILRSRGGVLSNSYCKYEGENKSKCILQQTNYDLNDPVLRNILNSLGFVCDAGGRRFRVCVDQPGICRRNSDKVVSSFLGIPIKKEKSIEYIPQGKDFEVLSVKCEIVK